MLLSIVIPAYNEEDAIGDTVRRTLAAGRALAGDAALGVSGVEVIVVNDGSRDATARIARGIDGVRVIDHPVNRGYGAAIKTGFDAARGEWLGFLDADGTCDPEFFSVLLRISREQRLDVACGSRMHAGSRMPRVRRLGNWLFRTFVNAVAGSSVADVASGMRVVRREALPRLYPLPDGLNFTPAMSVRALLDQRLRIGEAPMPYEERVGESKLSVVRDGLRFLGVIVDTAITYRPLLFFGAGAAAAALVAAWALLSRWTEANAPLPFYLRQGRLEDWMIFRVALASILLGAAGFLIGLGTLAQSLVAVVNRDRSARRLESWFERWIGGHFVGWGIAALALAVLLNRRLLAAYFTTGHIPQEFWVFPLVGGFCALVGAAFVAFGLAGRIIRLLREREAARGS